MNLPFIKKSFLSKKNEHKDVFLALIIKSHHIGAIVFEEVNKSLSILSSQQEIQKKNIQDFSAEELTEAADDVISAVEAKLPQNAQLEKTIFAVPSGWVEDGHIKKDYLLRLKKVCEDLALKPIGFIVSIEAIVAQLQKKQGAPITCIFVENAKDIISVFIVKAGNIVDVKSGPIEESAVKTVENLLKNVSSVDVFPSKIVLLNSENSHEHQDRFLSHRWTQHLPFLHEPQVVTLEQAFENESIINGVAGQMGFDVLTASTSGPSLEKKIHQDLAKAEDLGFLKEQDVALSPKKESPTDDTHTSFESSPHHEIIITDHHESLKKEHVEEDDFEEELDEKSAEKPSIIDTITKTLSHVTTVFKHISFSSPKKMIKMKGLIVVPIVLIVLLFGIGYIYYNFILKSTVVIFIDKKTLDKDVKLTLSTNNPTSAQDAQLHLKKIEEEVSDSETTDTTGKKETGEKAKGEVTIYNKTDAKKSFSKGTSLVSTNGLEFVTLDDVAIASTSAFSTNFSSAKIKVEAAKFGSEYNLPSNTNFSLKDSSTSNYFAKNESAFAGGTKKNITVVAKKDMTDLEQIVSESSKGKAFSQATSKISSDEVLLSSPISVDFKQEKFDKKEDQEATKLSLSATVVFTLGTYKKTDLDILVKELGKGTIPQEYNLSREKSNIDMTDITVGKNDEITGLLKIKANYEPTINSEEVSKEISGKSLSDAQKIAKKTKGVSDVTIVLKNNVPVLPNILPMNPHNIIIDIKSE